MELLIDAGANVDMQAEVSVSSCMYTSQRLASHRVSFVMSWLCVVTRINLKRGLLADVCVYLLITPYLNLYRLELLRCMLLLRMVT